MTKSNFNMKNHTSQEDMIRCERHRQASWAFNLAFIFIGAGSLLTLISFTLFLAGYTSKAKCMTVGGLGSTAIGGCCILLYRDANNRLDKITAKKLENQLDEPDSEVEGLENNGIQDSNTELFEETDDGTLTNALEKIEQAILSDGRIG